ncbi:hypothetical protein Tco_0480837 [Tanacetum coccineum]
MKPRTMKKKVQIMLDEEVSTKLQAEFDEEERLKERKLKNKKKPILLGFETKDEIPSKDRCKEKRAGTELIQENVKKQKVDDDKETTELKQCLEIIPDEEEVTIDAIPLAVKSPRIVDWKIHKE